MSVAVTPASPVVVANGIVATMSDSDSDLNVHWPKRRVALSCWGMLSSVLTGNYVNVLLIFMPFGIAATLSKMPAAIVFFANCLPIIPLAWILGAATEMASEHTGQVVGGFLNATFGNAVEVILSVVGLRYGMVELVQASLLGSILSNMLLVLGTAFFLGGLRYPAQTFNASSVSAMCGLLLVACISISLPTSFAILVPNPELTVPMSHIASVLLTLIYVQFLWYQLRSHSHLFDDEKEEEVTGDEETAGFTVQVLPPPLYMSILLMIVVGVIVSVHSQFLIEAVDGTVRSTGMNERFIGVILLPIIGNAAEHVAAVTVAMRNKMTLSVSIALGSATQIAICVIPLTVLVGWAMNVPMDLNFNLFEIIALVLCVLLVTVLVKEGKSTWFEGSLLLSAYFLVGLSIFYLPSLSDEEKKYERGQKFNSSTNATTTHTNVTLPPNATAAVYNATTIAVNTTIYNTSVSYNETVIPINGSLIHNITIP